MAEIEIGILDKQCLNTRIDTTQRLVTAVAAWQKRRNQQRKMIDWTFTREKADKKLAKYMLHNYLLTVLVPKPLGHFGAFSMSLVRLLG